MEERINFIENNITLDELENQFIADFIRIRKENNLTQHLFGLYSSVNREKIARIENKMHSPSLRALIDILGPIGYTIKIEKINNKRKRY